MPRPVAARKSPRATTPAIIARMQKTPGEAPPHHSADSHAQQFIARWQGVALTAATELSTSQTFVMELCALLGVPTPTTRRCRLMAGMT